MPQLTVHLVGGIWPIISVNIRQKSAEILDILG